MNRLLVFVSVFLALFVVLLDNFVETHCVLKTHRSFDRSTLKIYISGKRYLYISLEDNPEFPAIQFVVDENRVTIFDKQANVKVKYIDGPQGSWNGKELRQFEHHGDDQFQLKAGFRMDGISAKPLRFSQAYGFQLEKLSDQRYTLRFVDVPNFSLSLKESDGKFYYEIKSPLYDLETRIDESCQIRVFRRGVDVDQPARLGPIEPPPTSADSGWNPMDSNSWTPFDRSLQAAQSRQNQAGPSSTSGFRFAKPVPPLEPFEPEDPDELDLM